MDGDLPRDWLQPRPQAFLGGSTDLQQQLAAPLARGDLRNSYEIKEQIGAGYAMAEFSIPVGGVMLRGDAGLRYAHTRQTSSGYLDNGVFARPVSFVRDYGNLLPSFNLAAKFSDSFQMRFAASPEAPRVEFYADIDGDGRMDMMMGDKVRATGRPVHFRVKLTGKAIAANGAYTVTVIKNGDRFDSYPAHGPTPAVDFVDTPANTGRTYYRVQVEGTPTPYPAVPGSVALSGNMVGLSNPIYFNFDPDF